MARAGVSRSLIQNDRRLIKEANKLKPGSVQQETIDSLTTQLNNGSLDPGIGTKKLFGTVFEARARDGASVYFRVGRDGVVEILAKSTKHNQQRVINILRELYGN